MSLHHCAITLTPWSTQPGWRTVQHQLLKFFIFVTILVFWAWFFLFITEFRVNEFTIWSVLDTLGVYFLGSIINITRIARILCEIDFTREQPCVLILGIGELIFVNRSVLVSMPMLFPASSFFLSAVFSTFTFPFFSTFFISSTVASSFC